MAVTPIAINAAITVAALDLYTAFTTGTVAMLVSIDFQNTTSADVTVDGWKRDANNLNSYYFADDLVVPAKGTASWRGIITLSQSGDKIRASASATGVDANGTVMEIS